MAGMGRGRGDIKPDSTGYGALAETARVLH